MSEQWTVEAIEKKRWLAQQHRGREGELAALDEIERLLELQGELAEAAKQLLELHGVALEFDDGDVYGVRHNDLIDAMDLAEFALAKAKGETN